MVWVSSVREFRCGTVLVLVVFLAASCCGLAVVRGFWCGSDEGCFWILVWDICGSAMEVVCGFWFWLFVGQQQRCGFWFGLVVGQ